MNKRSVKVSANCGSDLIPIVELFRVTSSFMKYARSHISFGMFALLSSNLPKNFDWLRSIVACVVRFVMYTGVCTTHDVMLMDSLDQSAYGDSSPGSSMRVNIVSKIAS